MSITRQLRKWAVVAAMALLAVSCGGAAEESTTTAGAVDTTPAAAPTTSVSEAEVTSPDSESATAADYPDVITIGVLDDLTGPAAFCGTEELQGIEVAVAEAEANGFFGESEIDLVVEDSASNPDRGLAGYQALVDSDAAGILGPCVSTVAAGIVQRAAQDEVPIVLTTSGSEPLAEPEWVYRAGVVPRTYGPSMVSTLQNLGVESTSIILSTENPVHTVLVDEVFKPGLAEAGIEVLSEHPITPEVQDISAEITTITQADPDAIGLVVTGGQNLTVLTQLRQAGLDQLVWGQIGMHNPSFVQEGGDVTNGVIFMTSFAPCLSPNSESFSEQFEEATGLVPGFAAAHGYDAAWRLFLGIEAAGSTDRAAVNDALANTVTSQDGAQGPLTFDELGNSIGEGGIVEIADGTLSCIG